MNVLVVEPGMAPHEKEISGLEEMQTIIGGRITTSYPLEGPAAIVSHGDGVSMDLPFNRSIAGDGGIFGPFLVCGLSENQGYVIRQSVLFDNGRGFVLGEHPREGFVTWQFTEEQGHRDYYWGHYHSDESAAKKDYADRAADYQSRYGVQEIGHTIFRSLTPEQMEHFKKKFHQAEILIAMNGSKPITLKVDPMPNTPPEQPKHQPKKPGR